MAVEAAAASAPETDDAVILPLQRRSDGIWQADWAPLLPLLLDGTRLAGRRAAAFHASLALTLVNQATTLRERRMERSRSAWPAVSFQNRYLTEMSLQALAAAGFRAYLPPACPATTRGWLSGRSSRRLRARLAPSGGGHDG